MIRVLATFLFLLVGQAHATPPRVLVIHDQPVANTATHLFHIRTVSDNTGRHQISLTHRFLVRQDIKTGAVDRHWPLRHLLVTDDWINTEGNPQHTIEIHEPPESGGPYHRWRARNPITFANPFDVLRKAGAAPLSPFNADNAHNRQMSWAISVKHGLVKGVPKDVFGDERNFFTAVPLDLGLDHEGKGGKLPAEANIVLSPDALRNSLTATMLPTLHWLQDQVAPTEAKTDPMSWNREGLPLDLALCQIREHISLPITGGKELVSVDCEGDNDVARFRVWVGL